MFSEADWTKLKEESKIFCYDFLQRHVDRSVEENYSALKQHLTDIINKYTPSYTTRFMCHHEFWPTSASHPFSLIAL